MVRLGSLKISFLFVATVLIFFTAGLLSLAPRARRLLGAYRIPRRPAFSSHLINLPPKSPPATGQLFSCFCSTTLQFASDIIAVSPECSDYRVSQASFSLSPPPLRYAGRLLAVDRPGYTELIRKHAKADGPEGFLEGHLHCAVFRKRVKYAFSIHRVINADLHGETLWLFIVLGNRVGAHQNVVADRESRNGRSSRAIPAALVLPWAICHR